MAVDEYALQKRRLPARTGTGTMAWTHEEAPYTVAPMRDLTSYLYTTVAVVGPGQCGKTTIAENAWLHAVDEFPRNICWFMQTDAGMKSYVKRRLNPLIEMHPGMMARLGGEPEDNSFEFKKFDRMWTELLSATYNNLINKSAPFLIADEWDAWLESIGDPKPLLDIRRQYYGRLSKLLAMSHADLATGLDPAKHWRKGIMALYADSTRFVWYWPCPHCGAHSSPIPTAKRVMTLEYPKDGSLDQVQREAHLLCPVNGCLIDNHHRRAMNIAAFRTPHGGWVGQGQDIDEDGVIAGDLIRSDTAGYWIVGPMSNFLLNGIGGLARELVKAEREFEISGDPKTLKEVVVKQMGIPFTQKGPVGSVDADALAERAISEAQPLGVVPEGVRFLVCWVDVQLAHFEILVRGFGEGAESWVVDKRRVPAETTTDGKAWLALFVELVTKRYPLVADPARGMTCRCIGYDTQGAPGTTDRANETWADLRQRQLVTKYGTLDGRDIWSVMPTNGRGGGDKAPRLQVVYPDNQRREKRTAASGTVPWARFNADNFKDALAGQLNHIAPGPGYIHIPAALRSKDGPHVNFEQIVSERRDAVGRWTKPHQGVRNEFLDLLVGCHVLAHLHGLARINWQAPPPWAQISEQNPMIGPMTTEGDEFGHTAPKQVKARRTLGETMKDRKR